MKRSHSKTNEKIHEKLCKITKLCPDMNYFNILYDKELFLDNFLNRKSFLYHYWLESRGFKLILLKIRITINFVYEPLTKQTSEVCDKVIINETDTKKNDIDHKKDTPAYFTRSKSNKNNNDHVTNDKSFDVDDQNKPPNTWYISIKCENADDIIESHLPHSSKNARKESVYSSNKKTEKCSQFESIIRGIIVRLDNCQTYTESTIFLTNWNDQLQPITSSNASYSKEDGFCARYTLDNEPYLKYNIKCYLNEASSGYKLTPKLATLLKCTGGSFPRVLCALYSYIKANNLCSTDDPCIVNCNDNLKNILGIDQFHLNDIVNIIKKFSTTHDPITINNVIPNPAYFMISSDPSTPTNSVYKTSRNFSYDEYFTVEVPTDENNHFNTLINTMGPRVNFNDIVNVFKTKDEIDTIQLNEKSNDIDSNEFNSNNNQNSNHIQDLYHNNLIYLDKCSDLCDKVIYLDNFINNPSIHAIREFKNNNKILPKENSSQLLKNLIKKLTHTNVDST